MYRHKIKYLTTGGGKCIKCLIYIISLNLVTQGIYYISHSLIKKKKSHQLATDLTLSVTKDKDHIILIVIVLLLLLDIIFTYVSYHNLIHV